MKASVIIIGCFALIACGLANTDVIDRPVTKIKTVRLPAPPPRVITKIKTVRVKQPVAPPRPEGYMTIASCKGLNTDMGFDLLIARYGWPHGANGQDSSADTLYYPVERDPESTKACEIDFYQGKVDHVTLMQSYYP
jgi:hypothetical protein